MKKSYRNNKQLYATLLYSFIKNKNTLLECKCCGWLTTYKQVIGDGCLVYKNLPHLCVQSIRSLHVVKIILGISDKDIENEAMRKLEKYGWSAVKKEV